MEFASRPHDQAGYSQADLRAWAAHYSSARFNSSAADCQPECWNVEQACVHLCSSTPPAGALFVTECVIACGLELRNCWDACPAEPALSIADAVSLLGDADVQPQHTAIATIDADILNSLIPTFLDSVLPDLITYINNAMPAAGWGIHEKVGECVCLEWVCIGLSIDLAATIRDISFSLPNDEAVTIGASWQSKFPETLSLKATISGLKGFIGDARASVTVCAGPGFPGFPPPKTCSLDLAAELNIGSFDVFMEVTRVTGTSFSIHTAFVDVGLITLSLGIASPSSLCGVLLLPFTYLLSTAIGEVATRLTNLLSPLIGAAIEDAVNRCSSTTLATKPKLAGLKSARWPG